jgi:hypothetical protein
MKASLKRRIKTLERTLLRNLAKSRYAKVIYDGSSGFDPSTLKVDADVVLCIPDNGRRCIEKIDFTKCPYKIFYG